MRIVVCVKQVLDPKTVKISRSREEFDLRDAARITNPSDKAALELSLRLREASGGEVVALTVGDASAEDTVREAIAIGADRGVLVQAADSELSSPGVTRLLAAALGRLAPVDLVVMGQAGAVDGTGSLVPRLAQELGWPVLLDIYRLETGAGGLIATVAEDDQLYERPVPQPAVVAMLPELYRPRYPHPARIAVAWDAALMDTWSSAELGVDLESVPADIEPGGLVLGPERVRGEFLRGTPREAAAELLRLLRAKRLVR